MGPTLNAVHGFDATHVWAVGDAGRIQMFGGTDWKPEKSGTDSTLHGVWASSKAEAFAVGDEVILQRDTNGWRTIDVPQKDDWRSVSGAGRVAWAVGAKSTILRWDGTAWSLDRPAVDGESLLGVAAVDESRAWAVGKKGLLLQRAASGWTNVKSPTQADVESVSTDGSRVFFGTVDGDIFENAGRGFRKSSHGNPSDPTPMRGLWMNAKRAVAVGPGGRVMVHNGLSWEYPAIDIQWELRGVWMADATHGWAVGRDGTIVTRNPSGWAPNNSLTRDGFVGIWGLDENRIWAAGWGGTILRHEGSAWRVEANLGPVDLRAMWGADSDSVFVVGSQGRIFRRGEKGWVLEPAPTKADLWAVSGSSADDVWAAGTDGVVLHRVDARWQLVPSGTKARLNGIYCADAGHQWIVGTESVILRGDGKTLAPEAHGTSFYFDGIWGAGANDIWAFSSIAYTNGHSAIVRWDGASWKASQAPISSLRALWGRNADELWAIGKEVHRRRGDRWETHPLLSIWRFPSAVWGKDPDHVWVVADSGAIFKYSAP